MLLFCAAAVLCRYQARELLSPPLFMLLFCAAAVLCRYQARELLSPPLFMLLFCAAAVLCRYQARELWLALKNPLERMGVKMVCIVHEWIDREVNWQIDRQIDREVNLH